MAILKSMEGKKMTKKFVMLGEKVKGKIRKNEYYSVDEFMNKIGIDVEWKQLSFSKFSLFDWIFKKNDMDF